MERGPTADVFDHPAHPYTQMLLESVPSLHEARDQEHWKDVAAAREKGTCNYHDVFPDADAIAPASDDNPLMAEVEPGHLVTCATVDQDGGCVQNVPVKPAQAQQSGESVGIGERR